MGKFGKMIDFDCNLIIYIYTHGKIGVSGNWKHSQWANQKL